MKFISILLGSLLFLGTMLSHRLASEAWFFLPVYILAIYHLYRVNYSEGFFVVFQNKEVKEEEVSKIRLGPTEIGPKDEGDKQEEKFIALFDWKRNIIRNLLSWMIFIGTIYLYYFRLKMHVTPESISTLVCAFFLMRAVSVGHLLVPMCLSLFTVLFGIPDYLPLEKGLLFLYGLIFVLTLALIYPSEDKLGKKLKDWMTGRWMDIARTAFLILLAFCAGLFLIPEKFEKKPPVPRQQVEQNQKELRRLESTIRGMEKMGLMKKPDLHSEARELAHDLEKFAKKEERSPGEWKELQEKQQSLSQKVSEAGKSSSALTPELLEKMTSDLRERSKAEVDPLLQDRMEKLLKRMENYNGQGGKELISDYQEMKFGNKGYYREETEFQETAAMNPESTQSLEKMKLSDKKKKEISEKLEKNIEDLKKSPDEGLLSVNKALKDELEAVDSMSADEKAVMNKELDKTRSALEELASKTKNPEVQNKIAEELRKNQNLAEKITPHLRAEDKSLLASKVLDENKVIEEIRNEVRKEISESLKREEKSTEEEKYIPEKKRDYSKYFRLLLLLAGGFLFFWFMERLRKKGVEKVTGIPEELKEEIEEKLRELKKRKLSPREEVIETYNVLHNGLSGLVFTNETPPSCIVYEGMSAAEPELTKPLFTVTETFATTFYGDYDVTTPALKAFRKDVTKVFSFFDIQT